MMPSTSDDIALPSCATASTKAAVGQVVVTSRVSDFAAYPTRDAIAQWLARYQYLAHTHVVDALSRGYLNKLFAPRGGTMSATVADAAAGHANKYACGAAATTATTTGSSSLDDCRMLCGALMDHVNATRGLSSLDAQHHEGSARNTRESATTAPPSGQYGDDNAQLDIATAAALVKFVELTLNTERDIEPAARSTASLLCEDASRLSAFVAECRIFGLCHKFPYLPATTTTSILQQQLQTSGGIAQRRSSSNVPLSRAVGGVGPRVLNNAGLRGGPGVGLKKQYELDLMAPAVYHQIQQAVAAVNTTRNHAAASDTRRVTYEPSDVVVVDIGAGQGYLSAQLAVDYGLTVVAVERAEVQLHGSLKRSEIATLMQDREMALQAAAECGGGDDGVQQQRRRRPSGRLLVVGLDIGPETTVADLWAAVQRALLHGDSVGGAAAAETTTSGISHDYSMRRQPLVALVSLHACGPLSNNMLRLYADWQAQPPSPPLPQQAEAHLIVDAHAAAIAVSPSAAAAAACILCVNVGCCYNYLQPGDPDGFPVSALVRGEMAHMRSCIEGRAERHMRGGAATEGITDSAATTLSLQLSRTMTMTAVQAPFRWFGDGDAVGRGTSAPRSSCTGCNDSSCGGGTTTLMEDVPETFSMLYLRALLQRVLEEACGVDDLTVIGRVPAPKKRKRDARANETEEDVFVGYAAGVVDRVMQRRGQAAGPTGGGHASNCYAPTAEQLRQFYRDSRRRHEKEQLSVVWTLKVLIGHGIEALILADRCQYLTERLPIATGTPTMSSSNAPPVAPISTPASGAVSHHVELLTLFDPRESPRNQAVVARWR